jgi:serine/threonine-protein kinase
MSDHHPSTDGDLDDDRLNGATERDLEDRVQALAHTLHASGQGLAAPLLARGERIADGFEVEGLLGEGGMSQVYAARDLTLKRPVALKAALPSVEAGLLRREAEFLAAFRHPGFPTVYSFLVHRGIEIIAMERLTGLNLAHHLDRRGQGARFGVEEGLDVLYGVTEALSVLHNAGLAHRDLKPENIMLEPHGRVVLMDFGITRQERHIDAERTITGTPEYIAPESVLAAVKPGQAHLVDIYALGITAYELFVGRPPFVAEKAVDLLVMHVKSPPPDLAAIRRDLPPPFCRLVAEMLAKDPYDRPSSIDMVRSELRAIRAGLSVAAGRPPMSVLVVDDDPLAADLLRRLILDVVPSAEIRTAAHGEEAIEMFYDQPPEVAFLDLDMPKMNGFELCMYLKGTSLAAHTVLVVVSSHADRNREMLAQMGVADVVTKKDADPDLLAATVQRVLTRVSRARTRHG